MRAIPILAFLFICGASVCYGQVFPGQGGVLIPPGAPSQTQGVSFSDATVSGVGVLNSCTVLERVTIDIDHTWTGDVAIFLISPSGTVLELTSGNGGSANNWSGTTFRDDAPLNIVDGNPPYAGNFRPEGRQQQTNPPFTNAPPLETFTLANTFAGENADGVWQLLVNDYVFADVGVINSWELEFTSGGSSPLNASLSLSNPTPCAGDPVTVSVGGTVPPSATFLWSTGATSSSITVTPLQTSNIYAVTVTDGSCEQELDIEVNPNIPPDIIGAPTSCPGLSVVLTASGPGPFTWSTGFVGNPLEVFPTTTTTYTVTNAAADCNTSEPFTVTIEPNPLSVSVSDPSICAGDPVTLTATGGEAGETYTWSTGETSPSILVSPSATQDYTVTLNDGVCFPTSTVTVTVTEASVDLGTDRSICSGESITLTASGTGPFQWNTGQLANSITVSPLTTTTYSATSTNGSCSASDDITVTVLPAPSLSTNGPQTICSGEAVTLTATGTGPFSWSTGAIGNSITVTPTSSQVFSVVAGTAPCQVSEDIPVTVLAQPTLDLGGDRTLCEGEQTTLTASGNYDAIQWSTGEVTDNIPLHSTGTVTYTATASIGGCTVLESATITINPTPSVTASGDVTICAGTSTVLTATGPGPFLWTTGETTPSITVSPNRTTQYFVESTVNGCTGADGLVVTVEEAPTLDLGGDRTLCEGEQTILSASGNYDAIQWSTGEVTDDVPLHSTGTVTYTATASIGGCTVLESATITINPTPSVTASGDVTICEGTSTVLTATGPGPFFWTTGETTPSITVSPNRTTQYFVESTVNGCTGADGLVVTVEEAPTLDLGGDRVFCEGEQTTLTATGTYATISWNDGSNTSTINLHDVGTQGYRATVANGQCTVSDSITITIVANPEVSVTADQTICPGDSVTLSATGTGPFTWSTGEVGPNIRVSPTAQTLYSVSVGSSNCTASEEVLVSVAAGPSLSLGEDQVFCAGEASSLTATGNFSTILWEDGQSQPTIPLLEGTQQYVATATLGGCSVTDTVTITLLPETMVSAGPDLSVCRGDSLELVATGSGPLLWDNGSTQDRITVAPVVDTFFVVSAGAGSCIVRDTVRVSVLEPPSVDLGGDLSLCVGTDFQLGSQFPADAFQWSTGSTEDSIFLTATQDTSYTLEAITDGCSAQDTIHITVLSPVIDLGDDLTVCPLDSVNLTAPAATSYLWSNGFTGQTLSFSASTDTLISLEAIIDGCPATDSLAVSVTTDAAVNLGPPQAICAGDTVVLTAQGSGPFRWSTGEQSNSIRVAPLANTQFFATAGVGNCAVSDSVLVEVLLPAEVELGVDQSLCAGEEVRLEATGDGTTFRWSTGENTASINLVPTTDTALSVEATNAAGCVARDTVNVRVTTPAISLNPAPDICPGDSITLRAAGADNYLWDIGATTATVRVAPRESSTYRVTGFTENCPITDSVTVGVLPRARVEITGDTAICPGVETTLLATGDGPFRWNDAVTANSLVVAPDQPTTYFATAGEGNCADTAFFTLDLFPEITVDLSEDVEICVGDSTALRASTNGSVLSWGDGNFPPERIVSPTQTARYQVVAEANGCLVADSVTVTVNALPEISLVSTECAPDNLTYRVDLALSGGLPPYTLNGNQVGGVSELDSLISGESFTATVTDANACQTALSGMEDCGCTEISLGAPERRCNGSQEILDLSQLLPPGTPAGTWSVLNPDPAGLPALTDDQLRVFGASAGEYVLQYTPNGASVECLPDYRATLEIEDPPAAGSQVRMEDRCAESAGNLNLLDELIDASVGGIWEAVSDNARNNPAVDLANGRFLATGQPPGTYRFRYRAPAGAGCGGETAEVVIRLVEITVNGGVSPPDCSTDCSGIISVLGADPTWVYAINDAPLTATARFGDLCPGTYQLVAEDDRGCRAQTELVVPVVTVPAATIAGNLTIVQGDSTRLTLESDQRLDSIQWFPEANCPAGDCRSIVVRPLESITYRARFVNAFGCGAEVAASVVVDERTGAYVPTAFSPNGDGLNDLLTVYAGPSVRSVEDFRIYDRWGGEVINLGTVPLGDETFGWNGRSRSGRAIPPGVYVYRAILTRIDGTKSVLSGEVTLVR